MGGCVWGVCVLFLCMGVWPSVGGVSTKRVYGWMCAVIWLLPLPTCFLEGRMVWVPLRFGGRAHFHAMEGWADLSEGGWCEGELCVRVYVCMRVYVCVCAWLVFS